MRSTLLLATFPAIVAFVSASSTARRSNPAVVQDVIANGNRFANIGCYTDSPTDRVLPNQASPKNITVEGCVQACADKDETYNLAGIEDSEGTCWCNAGFATNTTIQQDETNCYGVCWGDGDEFCGEYNFMIIYEKNG